MICKSRGITVPDASGSTGTQAAELDGSAADNTTADNSDNE